MNRFAKYFFGAFAVCAVSAGNAFACGKGSISVRVVDEGSGGRALRVSEISDPALQGFVSSVTSHVESLIEGKGGCTGVNGSSLLFVRSPLVRRGSSIPRSNGIGASGVTGCRLYSPWVDLEVDDSVPPKVHGVIRWSQRQLLIDQAMMDGSIQAVGVEAVALSSGEFERYAKFYAETEILKKKEAVSLESPIPSDILWLFRKSWQSTRGPFALSAQSSMDGLMKRDAVIFAHLLMDVIDSCAFSSRKTVRYKSVLDLDGVVPLDNYRVTGSIHRERIK